MSCSHSEFLLFSILNESYTGESVRALTNVKSLIDNETIEASEQLQKVSTELSYPCLSWFELSARMN